MARYRRDSFAPDFSKADMIGEIGGMIGGIGEDLIRAEQASQLSKANIASTAEWGAAENYFKENADKPETFVSYIRNSKSAMQKSIMAGVTNSRARPQVMADFQESHAKMLVRAEGLASLRRAENIRVDHGIAIASLEKTRSYDLGPSDAVDHIEDIHKTVEYGLAAGQYTESGAEAEKVRLTNKAVGTYVTQELLKTGTPEKEALARIDSINSVAKDLFGTGENLFGPDDIDKLKKNYLAQKTFADYQQKTALEAQQAAAEEEIWDIARTGDVNGVADKIDMYQFDAEWKKKQLGDAMRTANLLKEDKPNPYTTVSDPAKYWSNYTKVLKDPDSMTTAEITAMVPDVCGINQVKEILNLKKTKEDDPLKSPQAAMYIKALSDIHLNKSFDMMADDWDRANRALINHIEKNPDDTPEQLSKFYNSLIDPYIRSGFSKWWEKWSGRAKWLAVGNLAEAGKATKGIAKRKQGETIAEYLARTK